MDAQRSLNHPAGDPAANPAHPDWEREFAPRISGAYQAGVIAIYALWLAFLVAMAVHRWFLSLQ